MKLSTSLASIPLTHQALVLIDSLEHQPVYHSISNLNIIFDICVQNRRLPSTAPELSLVCIATCRLPPFGLASWEKFSSSEPFPEHLPFPRCSVFSSLQFYLCYNMIHSTLTNMIFRNKTWFLLYNMMKQRNKIWCLWYINQNGSLRICGF